MSLFIKQPVNTPEPEKDSVTAMNIYESLKTYKGHISAVFSYSGLGVPMNWIKWVYRDAKRIESEIIAMVKANPDITSGEVNSALSSAYLNTTTVGTDVIHYNPTFDESRPFNQFKSAILS